MSGAGNEQTERAAAGWYADSIDPNRLRWWDGTAWTDHYAVPETTGASTSIERIAGAISHLGVPFWGLFLPLVVFLVSPPTSFRRRHARRAFSFQVLVLPFYLAAVAWTAFGGSGAGMLLCIAVAFVLELPQVVRALRGAEPLPLPPWQILRR